MKAEATPASLTVGKAIDLYIASKDSVLSPSTIAGYKRQRQNTLQSLMDVPVASLTQEAVQVAVNAMARDKSPKYVKNAYGLLSACTCQEKVDTKKRQNYRKPSSVLY